MSEHTPRLGLPLIAASQAQKHVPVNEALTRLDALVQISVQDRTLTDAPSDPETGDRYIVGADAVGVWAGHDDEIAAFDAGWIFTTPGEGWIVWDSSTQQALVYSEGAWIALTAGASDELHNISLFGVGTEADSSNTFSAKLNNALWTARTVGEGGSGDLRYVMNKEASSGVMSLLMQSGYSGRAEVGLIGDDDLLFKVSDDGVTWREAIRVEKGSGRVSFPNGGGTPGTAAFKNVGTSGDAIPKNDTANIFSNTQTIEVESEKVMLFIDSYVSSGSFQPGQVFRRARGSKSAPSALLANDYLASVSVRGYGTGSFSSTARGTFVFRAAENWTDAAQGTYFSIGTTTPGTTSRPDRLIVRQGLYHPSASGGDKGDNTINFGAIYDDNVLLSCYPFDAYLDGEVDLQKWDRKAPATIIPAVFEEEQYEAGGADPSGKPVVGTRSVLAIPERVEERQHCGARKFAGRLGTKYDPLDLDKYIAHWREKRHLTSMPNEEKFDPVDGKLDTGSWIQRLIETVEIQAIHISQLHERLKLLEGTVDGR